MSKKADLAEFEAASEAELTEVQGGCHWNPCMGGGCASTVVVAPQPAGYALSTQIPGAPYAVQTQQVAVVNGGGCRGGWGKGWGGFFRW
jgi:hypothetical protein